MSMRAPPNDFSAWREFAADQDVAAREVHRRVATCLSPSQRRAVVAWLPEEKALAGTFVASTAAGGPLRGIPYFIKDLFDVARVPTFAGSTFLPEVRPTRSADGALIQALQRTGAVAAGKTQMHEFAYGITGENPNYGDCEHPQFPGRTTGGSSSGSVAAVAGGIVPFALGSDTGGSVRVPAAFCGLFGFRQTPGHPWIADAFPLSTHFDTAGWFTTTAEDLLAVNAALLGLGTIQRALNGCYLECGELDPEVAAACRRAAQKLCSPADSATRAALLHGFAGSTESYAVQTSLDAAAAHAGWLDSHRGRYSPMVWDRIDLGRCRSDEERTQAAIKRLAVRALWASYFLTFDYLVMPATPCPALTKAQCDQVHRQRLLELTTPASLGGLPVLTLPVALESGLTAGLQVIVNHPQSPVISYALERWR